MSLVEIATHIEKTENHLVEICETVFQKHINDKIVFSRMHDEPVKLVKFYGTEYVMLMLVEIYLDEGKSADEDKTADESNNIITVKFYMSRDSKYYYLTINDKTNRRYEIKLKIIDGFGDKFLDEPFKGYIGESMMYFINGARIIFAHNHYYIFIPMMNNKTYYFSHEIINGFERMGLVCELFNPLIERARRDLQKMSYQDRMMRRLTHTDNDISAVDDDDDRAYYISRNFYKGRFWMRIDLANSLKKNIKSMPEILIGYKPHQSRYKLYFICQKFMRYSLVKHDLNVDIFARVQDMINIYMEYA